MDFKGYQELCKMTATFPGKDEGDIVYPTLGLCGEAGEVSEKVKKLIRDDNGKMTPDRAAAIGKELGDCCWYLANICCDIDLELEMIHAMCGYSIKQHIRILTLPQLVIHLHHHATLVAGALEILYYEYGGDIRHVNRFPEITNSLSNAIVCIKEIAHRCNSTLEEICAANIEKLSIRKQKGTLKGSGDNR